MRRRNVRPDIIWSRKRIHSCIIQVTLGPYAVNLLDKVIWIDGGTQMSNPLFKT